MKDTSGPAARLSAATRSGNIPLICTFELTRRCNLRCKHCYLDIATSAMVEMSTVRIKAVLDSLAAAGTLSLVFTGGEIFLRRDIRDLCVYARALNFDLRLFTNGTLITDAIARFLGSLSLSGVEISLYGKRGTHELVTGVQGSFDATVRSIGFLTKHAVPVTIKAPLMTFNFNDREWLRSFAARHGVKMKLDPILSPRDDGRRDILRYRLSTEQLQKLYADKSFFTKPVVPDEPDLSCSAARNLIAIGCDGTVYPCLQLLLPLGNLHDKSLSAVWSNGNVLLRRYRAITTARIAGCDRCRISRLCQRCPGMALVEDGDLRGPSRIACQIASIIDGIVS